MKPGVRRSGGFSLLEALVAGAIFFIAVVAISLLSVQGANNASKGMRYAQAARVASQEVERWSMFGYGGLYDAGAGVLPFTRNYTIFEQPDAGGRQYLVVVAVSDSSGPPAVADGGVPPPQIGTLTTPVPSYFVDVRVSSLIPNSVNTVSVNESTYVSPN